MKDENFATTEYGNKSRSAKLNGAGIFFLITTLVLLGAGIFLFADNTNKAKQTTELTSQLTNSEKMYSDLDAKYESALSEIESYKGKNATLDSILTVKEKDVMNLRASLNKARKTNQLTEAQYKSQVNDLNTLIGDLNNKITELQKQNGALMVTRDSLSTDITQKESTITQLQTVNTSLTQKVTVASLLIPSNINASAIRDKSSGKQTETSRARKAQHLKICFDVPQNKVADAGEKTFLVRILSPEGSVLATQDQGSGTFTSVETGEQMQYSSSLTADYQQAAQSGLCTSWSQNTPFAKGNYTAQIYQDGYLVGTQTFELK